jgi:ATP-dependent helicase HrpB
VKLSSGAGAVIAPESGVHDGEFVIALDVSRAPARRAGPLDLANVARIRMASRVEREWLTPTGSEVVHRFDKHSGTVKAAMLERYDELVLTERPTAVDPEIAAGLLAEAWLARGPRDQDARLLRRLRFAGQSLELDALVRVAAYGARSLDQVELARVLPPDALRALDRDAPATLAVPSGRHHRLEYNDDGTVAASVKLQELFGLAETPRIGPRREPVVLSLLAPNGRPVQVTRDLRSFWDRTYPEVRKELRGRYPKHPWPEDPWNATPTARAKRRQT